jgi:hypothetical protein
MELVSARRDVALVMAEHMGSASAMLAGSWKWTARHTGMSRGRTGTRNCAKRYEHWRAEPRFGYRRLWVIADKAAGRWR